MQSNLPLLKEDFFSIQFQLQKRREYRDRNIPDTFWGFHPCGWEFGLEFPWSGNGLEFAGMVGWSRKIASSPSLGMDKILSNFNIEIFSGDISSRSAFNANTFVSAKNYN